MSLVNDNGMYMPVAPAYGGGGGSNGFGWADGSFWIIILFLFALMGNGFGNGNGFGGGGMMPYMISQGSTDSQIQRGFDQQSVMAGINGVNAGINSLANSQCSGFAGVTAAVNNGVFALTNGMNANQMAGMQQLFGVQTDIGNRLNNIAMVQQNCCCENRAAIADLKYTTATEACNNRSVVNDGLRDITAQNTANTTLLLNAINNGIQSLKDMNCQDKIDSKNETISNLRQEIMMKDLAASQTAQNAFIQNGFTNEVDQLYNRLNNCPVNTVPVYGRTPIFQPPYNNGCGCGNCGGYAA